MTRWSTRSASCARRTSPASSSFENARPVGIFTDRDLRNKVIAAGRNPASLDVRAVMSSPLAVIAGDDPLYQALYRMSQQAIHRLGVVGAGGNLVGIITDTDILRLQAHSPHQLVLDIEKRRRSPT